MAENKSERIEYYNKDLAIAIEVGNRAREGQAYRNLGRVYHSLGKFQQSIEYHKKDLSIAKEVGDRFGEGRAYSNLGSAYHSLGDFRKALEYHRKDLSIAEEVGDRIGEGRAYGNLGSVYHGLGSFEEAMEFHKRDLSIAKEVGDRVGERRAHGNLGSVYHGIGSFKKAIEFHERDLSIAKEVGDRVGEGRAYGNLGSAYHSLGNFKIALEFHMIDLSIAKEVGDRVGEGRACGNLGSAYHSLGDFREALKYHQEDLSIAKEVGDRVGEGRAYGKLGSVYDSLGQFEKALNCYQSSVKLFDITRASLKSEDVWRTSFRALYDATYTSLWSTLVNLGKINEALYAAEQGRAQALVDDLKLHYSFLIPQSVSLEPKEIVSYVCNELSTQTVFVALQQNKINFWVVSKGNKVEFRQRTIEGGDEDTITALVENTLSKIRIGRDDSLQPLYDAIIGPIADLCRGDELIIVPDGPFWFAPLSALSESIRIRTVPSLTSLRLITSCPEDYHSKSGALLVGDPCLEQVSKRRGRPKFSQLPGAKREVEMIGAILNMPPLTGKDATKSEVLKRMTSVTLIHIAAHARKENGEIALAPNSGWKSKVPKEKDYLLTMSDVQGVNLRARLVVLSCNHSGRGKVTSEGVFGIARAFLAAGARSVLVSLWEIDDESTMEFMKSFYQDLAGGKSASVALHQAMKTFRESERFSAARYWAPFTLIGDDVTLEFGGKELEHSE